MFALTVNTESASITVENKDFNELREWAHAYSDNIEPIRNWYLVEAEALTEAPYTELLRSWGDGSVNAEAILEDILISLE